MDDSSRTSQQNQKRSENLQGKMRYSNGTKKTKKHWIKTVITKAETMDSFDPKSDLSAHCSWYQFSEIKNIFVSGAMRWQKNDHVRELYSKRHRSSFLITWKEALSLLWPCKRFHKYMSGVDFTLDTNYRSLQLISSERSKPSTRLDRWGLKLQHDTFCVDWRPWSQNAVDSCYHAS